MPNAPIAGPRRARPPALPPQPSAQRLAAQDTENAPTMPYQRPTAPPAGPGSTRALPPLDYDESGRGPRPKELEETQPGTRRRSNRVLWFALGIAFGAVAAVCVRGDAAGTLQAARAWGASTLRSLEHVHAAKAAAPPTSMAPQGVSSSAVAAAAAEDPCAELLAPFAKPVANVPTVSIDDLPKVTPPPVVVAARRRGSPAARLSHAPVASEESADSEPAPAGINPDDDDTQAAPVRPAPSPAAAPVERPVREPPPGAQLSRADEPS